MSKSLPCARACARNLRKVKLLAQGTCARTRARNWRKENAQKMCSRKKTCARACARTLRKGTCARTIPFNLFYSI